ncbi:MAG TPA: DUF748 domain-containing protein [Azonexus sp.]|nr:DUF748 domain-containing protein [Azonexus sp.]
MTGQLFSGNLSRTSRAVAALKGPRGRRFGLWLAGLILGFGVVGYLAGPPLMKWLLVRQLSTELHRQVSIERIDINPYALSAQVTGVSVRAEGGKEVAGFDDLLVNLSGLSLFQFALVVDEIRLNGPRVAVARVADGKYDISDLLDEWLKTTEPSPTPRFSINNIQIFGGTVILDDQPMGKVHTVSDINVALPFISSLPYQAKIVVEPSFSAIFDGAPLVLKGRSTEIFEGKLESELNLDLDRLDLAGFQPYLPRSMPVHLKAGTLDTELRIVFKELSEKVFSFTVVGSAHISGFHMNEATGEPLMAWKRLDLDVENADLINRRFAVKRVLLDGVEPFVAVNRSGEMNWLRLIEQIAGSAGGEAKEPAAKAPEWSVGELRVTNGRMHWLDESTVRPTSGDVLDIDVAIGKIDGTLAAPIEISEATYRVDLGDRARIGRTAVKGVRVDLHGHRVDVAEAGVREMRALLVRNKEGRIEWLSSPVLKTVRKAREDLSDERPWQASVTKLIIDDVAVRVEDRSIAPIAVQTIDGFSLVAENLSTEAGKKGTVSLKSRINQKGSLKVDGSVQLMPLTTALKVETQAIPLLPLQPYFTGFLNIALTRGQVSSNGEVTAQMGKEGLNATYQGSLTLGDLLAVDKVNNADFLKWRSLYLGGVDFRLQPMAVNVGEVALSDFYSRLILSKEGRLNLQDIVRKPEAGAQVVASVPEGVANAAVAGRPAAPATSQTSPPPVRIAKVTLQGGTINFSDFFVKPNYTVNLTKVAGRVSALSSAADTVADLEVRGKYANSAPVQVVGKLNPLAAKPFLDIKADVTGVDLVPFSPYSGKYAGYNIDKGKLSLNVAYKLEDNKLTAENRLFIDQLTFGDKVESPDATKLPVNLAIALLKNNRGEIDLNLPISGSLDDPDFSIGGLVIKVIVNLFVKAVTSPFALLGSMFGGGEELSNIEFGPGRASLGDVATKRLESLAKALTERDSLKLEITGRADPEVDKEGLKRVAMERAVKSEKLREQIRKGTEGGSVDAIEINPAEYPEYLKRAYKDAKFPKPRNVIGMQKDLPVEEMEKLMLTNLLASDDDVKELALLRAETVQGWLIEQGKVPAERLFLVPPKRGADDKGNGSRVDFSLR